MEENQIIEEGKKSEAEIERGDEIRETRGAKWKFVLAFFLIVTASLGGLAAWKTYTRMQGEKEIQALAEALKRIEQESYDRAMADTYGGKTPQETLRMYIDAVEKGDYELASRYFVEEKREKELKGFEGSTQNQLEKLLDVLKKVKTVDLREMLGRWYDDEIKTQPTSESRDNYVDRLYKVYNYDNSATMQTKIDGYDFSIDFQKYPNGTWKIIRM